MKEKTAMTLPISQEAMLMLLGLPSSSRIIAIDHRGHDDAYLVHVVTADDEFINSKLGRLRPSFVVEGCPFPHVVGTYELVANGI